MVTGGLAPMGRMTRSPQHPFNIKARPFQLQPFFIAPVLAGETMKSLRMQSRCVTDPLANGLIGWWTEYYFFYVKLTDMVQDSHEASISVADKAIGMLTGDTVTNGDLEHSANSNYRDYYAGATGDTTRINWVRFCLQRLFDGAGGVNYFRTIDETLASGLLDSVPMIEVKGQSVFDSLIAEGEIDDLLDVNVDADASGTITAGEVDRALQVYQMMVEQGMTEMSYDEYLATFGIRRRAEESHRPELLRFVREWQYPSNTIDPSSGAPVGAVSWSIQATADKPRLFKEPGFLIGLTAARPKTYWGNQKGTATSYMSDLYKWLPAVMKGDPRASWALVKDGAYASSAWPGIIGDITDSGGAYIDIKDLFLYGEQYVNHDMSGTMPAGINMVALPGAGLEKRYADSTSIDAFFKNAAGGLKYVRQDGLVSLSIAGRQMDTSAATT